MPEADTDAAAWSAFRAVCAMLAPSASHASAWPAIDWNAVVRVAQQHKVAPALWSAIASRGDVPTPIRAYFQMERELNVRRNTVLMDGLEAILVRLNGEGIVPALLKGSASVASGLYADPAERLMLDLDLLVTPEQAAASVAALRALCYTDLHAPQTRWVAQEVHHLPALCAPSGDFVVELHTWLLDKQYEPMLPHAAVMQRATEAQWRSGRVRMLNPTDRLVHNIVHAQMHHHLSDMGTVEIRQLRELCLLVARFGDSVDWQDVARRFTTTRARRALSEQATHCRELMNVRLPVAELGAARTMARLRKAVARPVDQGSLGATLRQMIGEYVFWFVRDPKLALNLINPRWWPDRIRTIADKLRAAGNHDKA